MSAAVVAGLSNVGSGPRIGGSSATSGGLTRAGSSALTGIADPPSPSKPGSMEDAIKLWLKIGNVEKLQVRRYACTLQFTRYLFNNLSL